MTFVRCKTLTTNLSADKKACEEKNRMKIVGAIHNTVYVAAQDVTSVELWYALWNTVNRLKDQVE